MVEVIDRNKRFCWCSNCGNNLLYDFGDTLKKEVVTGYDFNSTIHGIKHFIKCPIYKEDADISERIPRTWIRMR